MISPRWGGNSGGGVVRQLTILPNSPKNYMELKDLDSEGARVQNFAMYTRHSIFGRISVCVFIQFPLCRLRNIFVCT